MTNSKHDRIWMLLHGELDADEAASVVAEIGADEDLVHAFQARNELDLLVAEALEGDAPPVWSGDEAPVPEPSAGEVVLFPGWGHLVRIAAVVAVLAGALYAFLPRDPLRWDVVRVVLLEQTRGGAETTEAAGLDVAAVRSVCGTLRDAVDGRYRAAVQDGEAERWRLRVQCIENAAGAFEVRVEGAQAGSDEFRSLERRRYPDVAALSADIEEFADAVVGALVSGRGGPGGSGQ